MSSGSRKAFGETLARSATRSPMKELWSGWRKSRNAGSADAPGPGGDSRRRTGVSPQRAQSDRSWIGVWGEQAAELRLDGDHRLQWRAPAGAESAGPALSHYFDAQRGAQALADALPWRSDAHLARCLAAFPGLRILRQPFGETLLCFLCSAASRSCKSSRWRRIWRPNTAATFSVAPRRPARSVFRRLPSWEELALLPESALRDCRLGFRARHVRHGRLPRRPARLARGRRRRALRGKPGSSFASCRRRRKNRRLRPALQRGPAGSLSRRRLDPAGHGHTATGGGLEAGPGGARPRPLRPPRRPRPAVSVCMGKGSCTESGQSVRIVLFLSIRVSIVIPCYNEAKTIPDDRRAGPGVAPDGPGIIVVDDGSRDGSRDLLRTQIAPLVGQGDLSRRQPGQGRRPAQGLPPPPARSSSPRTPISSMTRRNIPAHQAHPRRQGGRRLRLPLSRRPAPPRALFLAHDWQQVPHAALQHVHTT